MVATYSEALERNELSEDLFVTVINHFLLLGNLEKASDAAEMATTKMVDSNILWQLRMDVLMKKLETTKEEDVDETIALFEKKLKQLRGNLAAPLWQRYLLLCMQVGMEWPKLLASYKVGGLEYCS